MDDIVNRPLSRRQLLKAGSLAGVAVAAGPLLRTSGARAQMPQFNDDPFSLGVASGIPDSDCVVLWTRLAPEPLVPDGGMSEHDVPVRWEVARDERFRKLEASGIEIAEARHLHSVHAELTRLRPGREYFYRFIVGSAVSPVGRTRTLSDGHGAHGQFRFAFVSCQRYEHGWFTAHRALADEDLDLVVHLGDYIYENPITGVDNATAPRSSQVPSIMRPEAADLAGYRLRHTLYKTDPDLQACHAHLPWAVILDNHDAVWDGDPDDPPRNTLARRAAAYQAWWEHMPLPKRDAPQGPSMPINRRLEVGDLLSLHLLDTRQFRDDEDICKAPPPNVGPPCDPVLSQMRTMLGAEQESWLREGLTRSRARWDAIAQTVLMAHYNFTPGNGDSVYLSGWDGYPAARQRLLKAASGPSVRNPVVLSGDWHVQFVNDLKLEPEREDAPVVATEFVGAAASSDPAFTSNLSTPALAANPQVRYYSALNGYTRATVDRHSWRSEFVVADVKRPDGGTRLEATHVVEDRHPGAIEA